jgi:ribosomal peptide maturation radical SAM protein 1
VALVTLPWADVAEPSLGLAVLKAELSRAGIKSRVFHLYLRLLADVTYETYKLLSSEWGLNEFLFTSILQPEPSQAQYEKLFEICDRAVEAQSRYERPADLAEMILRLDRCCDDILSFGPSMVGMTCMFDQTIASVALAQRLKQRDASLLVVLGGYALEGPPGDAVLNSFDCIDAIARGDGEASICELAKFSMSESKTSVSIPGVAWSAKLSGGRSEDSALRTARGGSAPATARVNLNLSPDPDFSDWFNDVASLRRDHNVEIITTMLPVEGSRGCWWGQTKHCVFCGIDKGTLIYRNKTPDRILDMLQVLRASYGNYKFRFSDYIMPTQLYDALPVLAKIEPRYALSSEMKANQNAERMHKLSDAGFVELQPGIESFSSPVLRLMDKGVSAIRNVATIKQGYVNRIIIHYNLLYGIPGEQKEFYLDMLSNMPRLYHLTPPVSRTETFVTRFAPLHTHPERFGYREKLKHHPCYDVLFSEEFCKLNDFNLDNYAYYFDSYYFADADLAVLHRQLVIQVNHWKALHKGREVYLEYSDYGNSLEFSDTRFGAETTVLLNSVERDVYCYIDDDPKPLISLASRLDMSEELVSSAISVLDDHRLIWIENGAVFGLGVPKSIARGHMASQWTQSWPSIWC